MLRIKKKFYTFNILIFTFLLPILIFAQEKKEECTKDFCKIKAPVEIYKKGLVGFLQDLVGAITLVAVPLIVLAFVYSGFYFVYAAGNSEKLKIAKSTFWMTSAGAFIILSANLLLSLAQDTSADILSLALS